MSDVTGLSEARQSALNLLIEHQDVSRWQEGGAPGLSSYVSECSCGSRDGRMYHLADLFAAREREAAGRALEQAADELDRLTTSPRNQSFMLDGTPWPVYFTADQLRARAAAITDDEGDRA